MKAIQFRTPGGPEVLELVEVPTPAPGPTEVLIKAHAIGVGMPEVLVRKGEYPWMPPLPAIPGIEMSGTVAAVGERVSKLETGQAVFASAREFKVRGGCYAEYLVAEEKTVYALPHGVDLDEAAALSNYQVAWHLLHSATQGFRYEALAVLAAAGGVGSALVQLAKAAGKRVVGVVDTPEKVRFALSQGADAAVDFHDGRVVEEVKRFTAGRGVDLVLDPVGGPGTARNVDLLGPFGMLILFGELDGPPDIDLYEALRRPPVRSLALRHFTMHTLDARPELRAPATRELFRLLAAKAIKPPIFERIPLAEARRAHELLESGRVLGKLIMKP
jgi:NADPH2:quinone reductase